MKVFKFYLENYRLLHHLMSFGMFLGFIFIFNMQHLLIDSLLFQIFFLLTNYFVTEFCLRQVGLTKEFVEKELKELNDKKTEI